MASPCATLLLHPYFGFVRKRLEVPDRTILQSRGLTKAFGDFVAVSDVTYSLTEGEAAGIIGPNGAGKSTFFNLLTGMFRPSSGSIFFHDQEITSRSAEDRVGLGLVRTFQLVSVFDSLSVLDNLVLAVVRSGPDFSDKRGFLLGSAHSNRIRSTCERVLEQVGLVHKSSVSTSEMSYGEKRMLEIGMALALKPKILLLDEPLAGLSDVEIHDVLNLVSLLKNDFTLVIIEHKISRIVNLVTRLSVMHEGRLIAEGLPETVLCDPTVRRVYWGEEERTCPAPTD